MEMEQADRQKTLKAVLHYFYQDNVGRADLLFETFHPVAFSVAATARALTTQGALIPLFHFMPNECHFMHEPTPN